MSLLKYESQLREPLIDGSKDYHQVTEDYAGLLRLRQVSCGISDFQLQLHCCYLVCILFTVRLLMAQANGT